MAANQSVPRLNRDLSPNFWWLKSANHVKSTEDCVMSTEKPVLAKKMLTNKLNIFLPLRA